MTANSTRRDASPPWEANSERADSGWPTWKDEFKGLREAFERARRKRAKRRHRRPHGGLTGEGEPSRMRR